MRKSAVGRGFDEIVQERVVREPAFGSALLEQAVQCMLGDELPVARALIRNAIKGSIGYAELSRRTGTPEKSLIRMFGRSGNPTAANIARVLCALQQHSHVRLRVFSEPVSSVRTRRSRTATRRRA